jgi:hypothetical protein
MLLARLADRPLIFQETVVTKPRRIKTCDKKEKHIFVEYLYYYALVCKSATADHLCEEF